MGMTTKVKALSSPGSGLYAKHAKVVYACIEAEIKKLPEETANYFECSDPIETRDCFMEEKLEVDMDFTYYSADMVEGVEILVSDIPAGVEKIRFTNHW